MPATSQTVAQRGSVCGGRSQPLRRLNLWLWLIAVPRCDTLPARARKRNGPPFGGPFDILYGAISRDRAFRQSP